MVVVPVETTVFRNGYPLYKVKATDMYIQSCSFDGEKTLLELWIVSLNVKMNTFTQGNLQVLLFVIPEDLSPKSL